MESSKKTTITVQIMVNAPVELVWKCWTTPEDIEKWNNASDDWQIPYAENDLRDGGKFNYRMEAKDGSIGFDFWGVYKKVVHLKQMDYILGDDRKVFITFSAQSNNTEIIEKFEAENTNPIELQRNGWQAILNNFKKYVEFKI